MGNNYVNGLNTLFCYYFTLPSIDLEATLISSCVPAGPEERKKTTGISSSCTVYLIYTVAEPGELATWLAQL